MNREFTFTNWEGTELKFKVTKIMKEQEKVYFKQEGCKTRGVYFKETDMIWITGIYGKEYDCMVTKADDTKELYDKVSAYIKDEKGDDTMNEVREYTTEQTELITQFILTVGSVNRTYDSNELSITNNVLFNQVKQLMKQLEEQDIKVAVEIQGDGHTTRIESLVIDDVKYLTNVEMIEDENMKNNAQVELERIKKAIEAKRYRLSHQGEEETNMTIEYVGEEDVKLWYDTAELMSNEKGYTYDVITDDINGSNKVIEVHVSYSEAPFGECGSCGYELNSELTNEYNIKYCPQCGTKLD